MNQLDDITMMDRSWRSVHHQILSTPETKHLLDQNYDFQQAPGQTGDLPARMFDDPPVVDVFEGITGDLLLV